MAKAEAVIEKNEPETQPREAIRNRYCKFSRHNSCPPEQEILISKSEYLNKS